MASTRRTKPTGSIALVGGGPGDPGLLTVRGRDLLAIADVVVLDPSAVVALQSLCRPDAEVVTASAAVPTEHIALMVARAKEGRLVVRVLDGDPFVFGRGAEEAEALAKARVAWEVVPGVTAAVATPAYAGIPVAHPRITNDVALLGGVDVDAASAVDWRALAAGPRTLVLMVEAETIGKVAARLVEHGRPGDTPVAMTTGGTTAAQRTIVATLDTIEQAARSIEPTASAVTVVGEVVSLRDRLGWWESRPLFGKTVLVPRSRAQAAPLSEQLRLLGATTVEVPTIAIEPPRNDAPMERAVGGLVQGRYAWVAFTSTNSVRAVRDRLDQIGLDARVFAGVRIAAVGEATAEALAAYGLRPDLVPSEDMSSQALADEWPWHDDQLDPLDRVLLPRADIATEALVSGLKAKGWAVDEVTAYRTVRAAAPPVELREAVRAGDFDAIVFTSSSTVRNLLALVGKPAPGTVIAAIGPQTAATAEELGLRVDTVAAKATLVELAAALGAHVVAQRDAVAPTRTAVSTKRTAKSAPSAKSTAAKSTATKVSKATTATKARSRAAR